MDPVTGLQAYGRHQALPSNIKLGCSWLRVTNTLAYYGTAGKKLCSYGPRLFSFIFHHLTKTRTRLNWIFKNKFFIFLTKTRWIETRGIIYHRRLNWQTTHQPHRQRKQFKWTHLQDSTLMVGFYSFLCYNML